MTQLGQDGDNGQDKDQSKDHDEDGAKHRARPVLHILGWLALAGTAPALLARATGVEAGPLAIAVALLPWMTLACAGALALALLARARVLGAVAALAAIAAVAWQLPVYVASNPAPAQAQQLTVGSVNVTFGEADAQAVVDLVGDHSIGLLAVQELTPRAVTALTAAGLDRLLPYRVVYPEQGFAGTGIWSATPLGQAGALEGLTARTPRVTVEVAGTQVTVVAPHPAAPGLTRHDRWEADLSALHAAVATELASGPVLVVGDFNATRDHRRFRDLEALGCADAADQAGAGFLPTFPQGRPPFPLVAIDHSLACAAGLVATQVSTHAIPGADHRALVAVYSAG